MHPFLTPWRLKWYPRLLLFALAVGFVIGVLGGQGAATLSGRLGGDFAEFYAAGRMVVGWQGFRLYEAQAQQEAQRDLHPDEAGAFVPFVYPPFWAAAYAPLSLLPYRVAFILHTFLMLAALAGALKLFIQTGLDQPNEGEQGLSGPFANGTGLSLFLQRILSCQRRLASHLFSWAKGRPKEQDLTTPISPDLFLLLFTAALLFYPVFRSILGGQNTALTLLLTAWWAYALQRGQTWRAGVPLGLLLFKPQFALPVIALSFLAGRWRASATALGLGVLFIGVSCLIAGPHWPQAWLAYAAWAMPLDTSLAGEKLVGWLGFFQSLGGVDSAWSFGTGLMASLVTAAFLTFVWFRASRCAACPAAPHVFPQPLLPASSSVTSKAASAFPPPHLVAATLAGLVLLSPHALFYDAGLLLPALWLLLQEPAPKAPRAATLLWLSGFTQLAASALGFSPLFFLSLGVFLHGSIQHLRSLGNRTV